jgi:hypothetical protein
LAAEQFPLVVVGQAGSRLQDIAAEVHFQFVEVLACLGERLDRDDLADAHLDVFEEGRRIDVGFVDTHTHPSRSQSITPPGPFAECRGSTARLAGAEPSRERDYRESGPASGRFERSPHTFQTTGI